MDISTQHMKEPSECSIESIRVLRMNGYGRDTPAYPLLRVSLKPEVQSRACFGGEQYFERRKVHYTLTIRLDELQQMIAAITSELDECYRVMEAHGLLHESMAKEKEKTA